MQRTTCLVCDEPIRGEQDFIAVYRLGRHVPTVNGYWDAVGVIHIACLRTPAE